MNLFEGVVIGIYGNWLISFVDKISFLKFPIIGNVFSWGYQIICVALAFATLLLLFASSIFRPDVVTRWYAIILGVGHVVGICGALWAEGWTIPLLVFYWIGVVLFCIIYSIELQRVRVGRRNKRLTKLKSEYE